MDLYPHQLVGADWLAARPRALLFDEQGLGKTITAITAADRIGAESVLVLAPAVVVHNWAREVSIWSPERKVQVVGRGGDTLTPYAATVIVSHALFHSPRMFAQLLNSQWDLLIVDELHNFRNAGRKRTTALYGHLDGAPPKPETELFEAGHVDGSDSVLAAADRFWGMTGTPIPNHVAELWTHLRALFPETIPNELGRPMSFKAFRSLYCVTRPTRYGTKVVGNKNTDKLKTITKPVTLRRLKKDHLDLPDVRFETVTVEPQKVPWEFDVLRGRVKNLVAADDELDDDYDPTAKQGFAMLRESEELSRFRRWCGIAKIASVVELLKGELEFGALDKVVVFAHHIEVIEGITRGLADYGPVTLTGATPAKDRQRNVDRFQLDPDVRVAVCNIVAGGVGITLHAAADVVFAEMSFVPGENAQAADRCHRIGQTRRVRVRCVQMAGTIDVDLTNVLTIKTRMIREVLS